MTEPQVSELRQALDRLQIHELLADYAYAVDTKDWQLLRTVFTDDAEVDYTRSQGVRDSIEPVIEWLASIITPETYATTQHLITNVRLILRGDTAEGSAYYFNPDLPLDPVTGEIGLMQLGGDYQLEFQRTADGWRIRRMTARLIWVQQCEFLPPIPLNSER